MRAARVVSEAAAAEMRVRELERRVEAEHARLRALQAAAPKATKEAKPAKPAKGGGGGAKKKDDEVTALPTSHRRFYDIAVNFTDPMFRGEYRGKQAHADDRERVLERAALVGVKRWLITGGNYEESKEAMDFCRRYAGNKYGIVMQSTVGCHPTRCDEFEDGRTTLAGLEELIREGVKDGTVAAVGECGLDYDREEFCHRDVQKKWFTAQLALAAKHRLPLFLHNRNTGGDFERFMFAHKETLTPGCVHSFTGTVEEVKTLLALPSSIYIGINGCSLKSEASAGVLRALPFERMMLETDAPWCDIRPTHAGHAHIATRFPTVKSEKHYAAGKTVKNRQEPCHMTQVFEVVCGFKGVVDEAARDAAAEVLYENAARVYRLAGK
eukprot:TRINITY_DN10148_c0_g1_i1.p1 TRINITY_DN10148_c0_g1~~TRINITY_DN10148_c0_g1_i1.p1  ORF type:complete len:383 (+),score=159.54 TRINITY_DN10148_c0_g1_i1:921-2069(+)